MTKMNSVKSTGLCVLMFWTVTSGLSRTDDDIIRRQGFVSALPVYQTWTIKDGDRYSEFSSPVMLYVPLSRVSSVMLRGARANTGGDARSLSGFTDAQLGLTYHLEKYNVVFSLNVNVPSGINEFDQDEFGTSLVISNTLFNFQVPNFGQGFNVTPGFVWAIPVSNTLVLGLGASYQYRGSFKPLAELDDYDPGDEILLTGGFDVRMGETSTLSVDMIFTSYGRDKLGGDVVFGSGSKIVANVQFRKDLNLNELRVLARYRTLSKSDIAYGGILVPEQDKVAPNQFELLASYRARLRETLFINFLAEARFFEESPDLFSSVSLFAVGIAPEFSLSSDLTLPARLKLQAGSLKGGRSVLGVELGAGLRLSF